MKQTIRQIGIELKSHAPFSILGAVLGLGILVFMVLARVPHSVSQGLFGTLHPAHVFFSAVVTTAMYRLHGRGRLLPALIIGYVGSVGIGTLSDCVIPFFGERLLGMEHAHAHIGFIELWWLVNPLAFLGVGVALIWPRTKVPHAGHVLLSTWASLFHMTMAHGPDQPLNAATVLLVPVFLFIAVWVPCCTSDIAFPLLFSRGASRLHHPHDGETTDHDHKGAEQVGEEL